MTEVHEWWEPDSWYSTTYSLADFSTEVLLDGFVYLATPYSSHPGGLGAAMDLATAEAGDLVKHRVPVFSPVAHSHPIAMACDIDPLSHSIWLPMDMPMLKAAAAVVAVAGPGAEKSFGIAQEIKAALALGKQVYVKLPRSPLMKRLRNT